MIRVRFGAPHNLNSADRVPDDRPRCASEPTAPGTAASTEYIYVEWPRAWAVGELRSAVNAVREWKLRRLCLWHQSQRVLELGIELGISYCGRVASLAATCSTRELSMS